MCGLVSKCLYALFVNFSVSPFWVYFKSELFEVAYIEREHLLSLCQYMFLICGATLM